MMNVLAFFAALGPVVFIHELGHFLLAKYFNVKVEVFSIGFGKKLLKKQWGETEYCISAIPLGGYVKILGQDTMDDLPAELRHRAYFVQEKYKKFAILFAGPLFNYFFGLFVFALIMIIGEPHDLAKVYRVTNDSYAYHMGLRSNDEIVAINGEAVTEYADFVRLVGQKPKSEVKVKIKRNGEEKEFNLKTNQTDGMNIYGEDVNVGVIDGVLDDRRAAVVGISNSLSVASKAGIKTGDVITKLNNIEVKTFEDIEHEFDKIKSEKELSITYKSSLDASSAEKIASIPLEGIKTVAELGLYSTELFVKQIMSKSPADKAGILPNDRIHAVNGNELRSFEEMKEQVQFYGKNKKPIFLTIERNGKKIDLNIVPESRMEKDVLGRKIEIFLIGVGSMMVTYPKDAFIKKYTNPYTIIVESVAKTNQFVGITITTIAKLFKGSVPMDVISGPLMIGKAAGQSLAGGLYMFLRFLALISVSLFIFNLLPIPVLDGGHIFFIGVEAIIRRPIPEKVAEIAQKIGLSLLLILTLYAFINDITKLDIFKTILGYLK